MLNKLKKSNSEGFTIIEVMIVLAIAGLIILVVLLAVPALQRNGRNTALKNDASAVAAAVNEFKSNNDGKQPTVSSANITASNGALTVSSSDTTTSPTQGKVQPDTVVQGAAGVKPTAALATGTIEVHKGATCDGDTSNRALTVWYLVEPKGAPALANNKCIDA